MRKAFLALLLLVCLAIAQLLLVGTAEASTTKCSGKPTDSGGRICLSINGTGLHVNYVDVTWEWTGRPGTCQTVYITVDKKPKGYNFFPFNQQDCVNSDIWDTGHINFNEDFQNNTKMIAQWSRKSPAISAVIHS